MRKRCTSSFLQRRTISYVCITFLTRHIIFMLFYHFYFNRALYTLYLPFTSAHNPHTFDKSIMQCSTLTLSLTYQYQGQYSSSSNPYNHRESRRRSRRAESQLNITAPRKKSFLQHQNSSQIIATYFLSLRL